MNEEINKNNNQSSNNGQSSNNEVQPVIIIANDTPPRDVSNIIKKSMDTDKLSTRKK